MLVFWLENFFIGMAYLVLLTFVMVYLLLG